MKLLISNCKRYTPYVKYSYPSKGHSFAEMIKNDNGEFIKYEDVVYIENEYQREIKELQDKLAALSLCDPNALHKAYLEIDLYKEVLETVANYFKDQGTGKVFHLGYKGDTDKNKHLSAVISSLSSHSSKAWAVMEEVKKVCEAWVSVQGGDWKSKIDKLVSVYYQFKENKK